MLQLYPNFVVDPPQVQARQLLDLLQPVDQGIPVDEQLPGRLGDVQVSSIEESLRSGTESTVVVGIGTIATHLRDLAKSYKEAQISIDVGKVFDTEKYVICCQR